MKIHNVGFVFDTHAQVRCFEFLQLIAFIETLADARHTFGIQKQVAFGLVHHGFKIQKRGIHSTCSFPNKRNGIRIHKVRLRQHWRT